MEQINQSIFVQSQDFLGDEAWKYMLRKKSEYEIYMDNQKRILQEIRK